MLKSKTDTMKRIAIIEGGYSSEIIISKKSAKTVFENVDTEKFIPIKVSIDQRGWFAYPEGNEIAINLTDFSYQFNNKTFKFDFAFIVIHGTPGEDGKLQAYFDMLNIPYSTSSHNISALTFNKYICNQFLKSFNIDVAKAILYRKGETVDEDYLVSELGLPCFVKPADGGSSFGITKVTEKKQLKDAIEKGMIHGSQVILESFLKGREVTNGIYKTKEGYHPLPIAEIVTKHDFFNFEAKYKGESQEIIPAQIPKSWEIEIKAITKKVSSILGLKGIARIDYIIVNEKPYLIEVNTVPGMTKESFIPQMILADNLSLSNIITEIIAS